MSDGVLVPKPTYDTLRRMAQDYRPRTGAITLDPRFGPPPVRAVISGTIAAGGVGDATMLGSGAEVQVYNPGSEATGDVPIYFTAGTEVSADNGDDPVKPGQWEILSTQGVESSGLPPTASGCNCSDCIEGTANTDCEGCGCLNTRRMVYPPELFGMDGVKWEEGSAPRLTRKQSGVCQYLTATFRLYGTVDEEEVYDTYQWNTYQIPSDPEAGTLACWKHVLEIVLGEGEEANLPIVTAEFTKDTNACDTAGADCLCPWIFKRGIFNNIQVPRQCKLCVSPIARSTTLCDGRCTYPFPSGFIAEFSSDGDGVVSNLAGEAIEFDEMEWTPETDVCDVNIGTLSNNIPASIGYRTVGLDVESLFPVTTNGGCGEEITSAILTGGWVSGTSGFGTVVETSASTVRAVLVLLVNGITAGYWMSAAVPGCSGGNITLPITLTNQGVVGCLDGDLPSTVTIRDPGSATSSGHVGGNCGAPVEPGCNWITATAGESTIWTVDGSEENCDDCYVPCASTYVDGECGNAETLGPGVKCSRDCMPPYETDYVEFTLEGGMGCEEGCLPASVRLCTVDSTSFEGPIVVCGESRTITLEDNGTDWTMTISGGGPITGEFEGPWTLFTDVPGCGTITLYLVV